MVTQTAYVFRVGDGTCRARVQGSFVEVDLDLSRQKNPRRKPIVGDWVEIEKHGGFSESKPFYRAVIVEEGLRQHFELAMIPSYCFAKGAREEDAPVVLFDDGKSQAVVVFRPSTGELFRRPFYIGERYPSGHEFCREHVSLAQVSFANKLPELDTGELMRIVRQHRT